MAAEKDTQLGIKYLDMQAYVGITKHIGGREATDTLLSLCHVENAHEVRLFYLYLTRPDARSSIKEQFGSNSRAFKRFRKMIYAAHLFPVHS